jgi:hypothetical protein
MASAFHTIWLGGCLPLRALENLIQFLQFFEQELPQWPEQPAQHEAKGRSCRLSQGERLCASLTPTA